MAAVFAPLIWAAGIFAAALVVNELWSNAGKIAAALNFEPIPTEAKHVRRP